MKKETPVFHLYPKDRSVATMPTQTKEEFLKAGKGHFVLHYADGTTEEITMEMLGWGK